MKINKTETLLISMAITLAFSMSPFTFVSQSENNIADQQKISNTQTTTDSENQSINENDRFSFKPIIAFAGVLALTLFTIWQMNRRHKSKIELQRQKNNEKFKSEIYKEYKEVISAASDKISSVKTEATLIVTHFDIYVNQTSKGLTSRPLDYREADFRDTHFAAIRSVVDLIGVLQEFKKFNPNFEIFQIAFTYANDFMDKAYYPFQQVLLDFLPYDVPLNDQKRLGEKIIIPKVPSKDDLERIKKIGNTYIEAACVMTFFVSDLVTETQNIFLDDSFSHGVPRRNPFDPKCVVLSTDSGKVKKLKKYFLEETEWGKTQKCE